MQCNAGQLEGEKSKNARVYIVFGSLGRLAQLVEHLTFNQKIFAMNHLKISQKYLIQKLQLPYSYHPLMQSIDMHFHIKYASGKFLKRGMTCK